MGWAVGVAVLLMLAVASAALAAAPVATTGPATAVGSSSATVSGTVSPGGQSTTWVVEYGTSTAYESKTAAVGAGSGTTAASVSAHLTGLKPGTTYHYRFVATNTAGTSHGGDAVFTTLVPPDVTTGDASSITPSSATLNGTVDANGRSTTYYFDYGSSTTYGTKTSAKGAGTATSAQPVATAITGLEPGRTYHFRLVATSDAGTTVGSDATFTTHSAPTVATGDVTSITPTAATVRGTVTPNGLSTTWWFEYGATTSYNAKTPAQSVGSGTAPRSVSQAIKSLRPGSTYHYRLVARNSRGTVAGADRSFSTTGAPLAQTGAAQGVTADAATLTGTLDTRGRSTTWWFEYGTSTSYRTSTPGRSAGSRAGAQAVSWQITGLTPATGYHFRLVVRSDAGTVHGSDVTFTTLGVSLGVDALQTVYGGRVRLSGVVPTHQANEQVVVYAQPYGEGSPRSVATVLSAADGTWQYLARPRIGTTYTASWRNSLSAPVAIAVHPRLALTRLRSGRFVVRVFADRSFAHRLVQLQRWNGVRWTTLRRIRLGGRSRAEFRATLPAGRSTLRSTFSVNQAGPGYLGATSGSIKVTIRR
jgi:phosphodiesterase/alkaline phosphatase D-like protein